MGPPTLPHCQHCVRVGFSQVTSYLLREALHIFSSVAVITHRGRQANLLSWPLVADSMFIYCPPLTRRIGRPLGRTTVQMWGLASAEALGRLLTRFHSQQFCHKKIKPSGMVDACNPSTWKGGLDRRIRSLASTMALKWVRCYPGMSQGNRNRGKKNLVCETESNHYFVFIIFMFS